MKMTNEEYNEYIRRKQPRSPLALDTLKAFLVGGLICAIGQAIRMVDGHVVETIEKQVAGLLQEQ